VNTQFALYVPHSKHTFPQSRAIKILLLPLICWILGRHCYVKVLATMMLSKEEEEALEPNSFDLLSIEEQLQSIHNTHEVVSILNRENKCQKILIQAQRINCFRDQIF